MVHEMYIVWVDAHPQVVERLGQIYAECFLLPLVSIAVLAFVDHGTQRYSEVCLIYHIRVIRLI